MRNISSYIIAALMLVILFLVIHPLNSKSIQVKECDIHITQEGTWDGQLVYTLDFPNGKAMELLTADEVVAGFMSGRFDYEK